jgi:hypothetical protein
MVVVSIPNLMGLHYSMQWIGTSPKRRMCVVCIRKVNWYGLACNDTIVCFDVCFVKLHSAFSLKGMGPTPYLVGLSCSSPKDGGLCLSC